MQRFIGFSITEGIKYHSVTLHVEDPEALKPGRPYVIGACCSFSPGRLHHASPVRSERGLVAIHHILREGSQQDVVSDGHLCSPSYSQSYLCL